MRDDGPSTDPDLSVPLRSFPSPWETHLSLASCDKTKLPTWDPGTGTKVASTLTRHVSIAVWPWLCEKGFPRGATTFHIIKVTRPPLHVSHVQQSKSITLDAAALRPNSLWNSLTVSDRPSLILFTADRMDSIRAGYRCACIDVESHATPRKVALLYWRKHTLFGV